MYLLCNYDHVFVAAAKASVRDCRHLTSSAQAQWCAAVLHLGYSMCTFVGAVWLLATNPRRLGIALSSPHDGSPLADALVCISAGFFAFHLWTLVHQG